jgi:uncharacterized membrane protein YsdA (DUF1294 family)
VDWVDWAFLVIAVNLSAFLLMGWDKHSARRGDWRIPEIYLFLLSTIGGALGTKAAQHRFRHKTQKQPFGLILNVILALQLVLILAWAISTL